MAGRVRSVEQNASFTRQMYTVMALAKDRCVCFARVRVRVCVCVRVRVRVRISYLRCAKLSMLIQVWLSASSDCYLRYCENWIRCGDAPVSTMYEICGNGGKDSGGL